MTEPTLKPCPFCGKETTLNSVAPSANLRYIGHRCEPGGLEIILAGTLEEVSRQWNTRADGWKPVSEPPSSSRNVLVLTKKNWIEIDRWMGSYWFRNVEVTHWRELPPLPGKEGK